MDFSITLDVAREALAMVPAEDRATWVRLGKALHDEYGDAAFDVWDDWSQDASNYNEKAAKQVWKSIARMSSGGKPVTIATLVYEAQQRGWKLTQQKQVRRPAEEAARLRAKREARREALRLAEEAAYAAAAIRAAAIWAEAVPESGDHPYLKRKGILSHGLRRHVAWEKEFLDESTGETRKVTVANPLLVPIYSGPGRISSLQAIFPGHRNALHRDKDYLTDGRKQGCYFPIGTITADTHTVIVGEGYATCATLHAAHGWPVMVAFDAGNLRAVVKMLRDKMPGCRIIVAADNDQFTKPKPDGTPWNPGIECAQAAAKEVGGIVVAPTFTDLTNEPTDWNDLAAMAGLDAVRSQFELALNPPPSPPPAEPVVVEGAPPPPPAPPAPPPTDSHLEKSAGFVVLGYDHDRYYLFQHERRQISCYTKGDFSESGLIELAPLQWWEENFPGGGNTGGVDKRSAMDWILRLAGRRGIYDISRIRGRGAWVDDGRVVYHHGGSLTVDGVPTDVTGISSRYVYELARSLPEPAAEALTSDEGELILELAEMFRWSKPGSAALVAGWVALAPMCGALKWRPHVWITGGAGCGKSTILNDFIHYLMAGSDVFAQGSSSEAGIRQELKADALPVLFDESESNEERDALRIQNILGLIRQSSTESHARTLKGTAGGSSLSFHIRSMFALASIQVAIKHQADIERLAVLTLRPKRESSNAAEEWKAMSTRLADLHRDKTIPSRLMRRSLDLLPVTLKNIEVFSHAAAKRFGSQREGDQYGTLLAGAWSLISTRVATEEEAVEMIDRYDWSEHLDSTDSDESERALSVLMGSLIRMPGSLEVSVFELAREAAGMSSSSTVIGQTAADGALQRHGMKVIKRGAREWRMVLSNGSQEIRRLMQGTPYEADLRGLLLRLPGSDRCDNKPVRFNGVPSKCISIDMTDLLLGDAQDAQQGDAF